MSDINKKLINIQESSDFIKLEDSLIGESITIPGYVRYVPKEDITIYELACIMPYLVFAGTITDDMIPWEQSYARHFEKT